ncbi:hypothetical protein RRG08_021091 [Elysia crispata]|uniref:Uncharacterized protein n=1 Tax=Elysia crispata TaxID=231223 RepID=A0AAE1AC93_9GAST|nr:hypothetical protein RRG08_021091 [Elysia crispata]
MASEKPVNLKKHKKRRPSDSSGRVCIIHNSNLSNYGDVKPFTEIGWKKICDIKCIRLQSDNPKIKLSNICEQIPEAPNDFCHGYHRPCYQTFTRRTQSKMEEAHSQAFHYICDYVQKHIIENATVERMTMLREKYLTYLQSKYPQEYNPNYKTDKLKQKLQATETFWRKSSVLATKLPK